MEKLCHQCGRTIAFTGKARLKRDGAYYILYVKYTSDLLHIHRECLDKYADTFLQNSELRPVHIYYYDRNGTRATKVDYIKKYPKQIPTSTPNKVPVTNEIGVQPSADAIKFAESVRSMYVSFPHFKSHCRSYYFVHSNTPAFNRAAKNAHLDVTPYYIAEVLNSINPLNK